MALRELRIALEQNLEPAIAVVQRLHVAVFQRELPGLLDSTQQAALLDDLERQFELGRLVVIEGALPLLGIPPELELIVRKRERVELPPLPPIARPQLADKLTFFEVTFVDEIGHGIGGFEVEFLAGRRSEKSKTNPAGVATLEDVSIMSASVSVVSSAELSKILDPRWERPRTGSTPSGVNTRSRVFTGQRIAGLKLKPAVPNTVVLTPPFGKLFVELFDKTGRVLHAAQRYSISGPQTFSGETDEAGRLLHPEVPRGGYELTLTVEVDGGNGETVTDTYKSPLVVLETPDPGPQLRMIGAVPYAVMARMRGMLFDTNKCFLLPTAIEALERIREIYEANNPSELLVVGHTDTTAQPDINDPLSKERADSIKAYLEDDVDAWLANYKLPGKKQWGSREDRLMITAMPGFDARLPGETLIEWFQRTRELQVDGVAGTETRTQLITEYMSLDGVELSQEPDFLISIKTHGAGENFPLADTGFELDRAALDEREDPLDRRVELFFFATDFGIFPAPGAPDGKEYLEWRKRAAENTDFPIEGVGKVAEVIEVQDVLFRTNSSVVLPEGEAPSADEHEAVTSVGAIAKALRFAHERAGKKLFIAGHADTTASVAFNQPLSEERARSTLALLEDDRESFVEVVDARHTIADYKQILSWCATAFPDFFSCDPGKIDDNEFTGIEPLKRFQEEYNVSKTELGAASQEDLDVDGDIGPKTWGAFFDVYQFGIREELGEDEAGTATLRESLVFADDQRKSLGFSELYPVELVGRDGVKSQANRRVEIMFFDEGEEPDLVLAESDPDITEIYLPAEFEHRTIDLDNALKGAAVGFVGLRGTTRFSANSDFPKPSLLNTVRTIQERLADDPELRVLLVGHADNAGVDESAEALSLARANIVKAWLEGDSAALLARFNADGVAKKWGFKEVQWMLQVIELGDLPCYVDRVDGYPGPNTLRALEYFQVREELPINGLADDATLERLAQRYVELGPTSVGAGRIQVVAAGKDRPPLPFGDAKPPVFPDDAPQRLRRVEAFLFPDPLNPPEVDVAADSKLYGKWCRRVVEAPDVSAPLPTVISLSDEDGAPVKTSFKIVETDEGGNAVTVASGSTNEQGIGQLVLPEGGFGVEAGALRGAIDVAHDEFGGQMLVVLSAEES